VVSRDLLGPLAPQVPGPRVQLEPPELRVRRDSQEEQDSMVKPELLDQLEQLEGDSQVQLELVDCQEIQGLRGPRALLGLVEILGLLEQQVPRGRWVTLDPQVEVTLEILDHRVLLDLLEDLGHQVLRELLG